MVNVLSRTRVGSDPGLTVANHPSIAGGPIEVPFEPLVDSWIERPILDRFRSMVERHGDRIAVNDGAVRLTYRELERACRNLASRIDASVPQQAPVGLLLPNAASVPLAILACLAVGRPFVPIDFDNPPLRNQQIMAEAGVQALLVDRDHTDAVQLAASIVHIDVTSSLGAGADDVDIPLAPAGTDDVDIPLAPASADDVDIPLAPAGMDDVDIPIAPAGADDVSIPIAPATGPALILYTSGSTGRPKGVCLDQRSISRNAAHFTNSSHLNHHDRIVSISSATTIVGTTSILAALLNGATLFIADPRRIGLDGVLRTLRNERITYCYAVPTLLRELMNAPEAKGSFASFRAIRLGGESVRPRDVALFRMFLPSSCHIQITYGSTETGTIFQWFVPPDFVADGPRMPCGYAVPDQSIRLDHEIGGSSSRGELVVTSRHYALGLWQDGRLQPGPFQQDPNDPSLRTLHTGDLLQFRDDGLADVVGRVDRQVKIRGLRVNPVEVEDALCRLDGVAEAVVTVRRDDEERATLIAFVVPRHAAGTSFLKDLQAAIAGRLPGHMRPTHVRVLSRIPLLPNFKPDVAALERLAQSLTASADDRVQESAAPIRIKDAIARAWVEVLGQQSFDPRTHWYETGGDSLQKLTLWLHVEKSLGMRIAFQPFEDDATPDEIAASIERALADSARRNADLTR